MSGCEFYQELISCLIDGELSNDEEAALADHLQNCAECAAMYRAFKELSSIMEDDMLESPETLCPNVMAELRRAEIIKKNRRKSAIKAVLATAACAVFVFAAGRLSGFGNTADSNATVAVYDVKMAKSESFAVPAEAPAAAAPQMDEGAALAGGTMITADITAAAPEAMIEEAAEEAAPMQSNTFSLALADGGADDGAVAEVVDWLELNGLLAASPAAENVVLPDSPSMQLTAFADGVYYSLLFFESDGLLYYFDPTDGVLKESRCGLSALQEFAKT